MTTIMRQLLLVLGLMVLVHEFGHFIVAKWCGVRVEAFAIGFGKRLVGVVRNGTDYRINALPPGRGYVKMAGEIPGEETSDDPGDLNNHPRWQRMLIAVTCGPVASFILAFGLMTGAYMYAPQRGQRVHLRLRPSPTTSPPPTVITKTGIHSGDTIVHFDNVGRPTLGRHLQPRFAQPEPDRSLLLHRRRKTHQHNTAPLPICRQPRQVLG